MFNVEQLKRGHLFVPRHQKESREFMLDAGLLIHRPENHRRRGRRLCVSTHRGGESRFIIGIDPLPTCSLTTHSTRAAVELLSCSFVPMGRLCFAPPR